MLPAARLLGFAAAASLATATARPALADADSLVDNLGPREVGTGEAMRAGATGAAAINLNPAGLPLTSEVVFEGGFGYRPSDHGQVVAISACDSTNLVPGCFYYNYVSVEPELDGSMTSMERRTHTAGLTLSRIVNSRVIVGTGVKYFDHESTMTGDADASGVNWDVGTTVRLTDVVNVAVVGYNLWGTESLQYPRAVGSGLMARPTQALTASFDAVWNLDAEGDSGRYGGGLEYFISSRQGQVGYPVRLGALHDVALDSTYVTAGLGLASMKVALDVGARRQVKDGDELLVTASLRFYGPRNAAP